MVPIRYLPRRLSKKDRAVQLKMLAKSRKMYKQGKYYTRKKVPSFQSKESKHIKTARRLYGVDTIVPSEELSQATGCSVDALEKIVAKGEGAYFHLVLVQIKPLNHGGMRGWVVRLLQVRRLQWTSILWKLGAIIRVLPSVLRSVRGVSMGIVPNMYNIQIDTPL